MQQYALTAISGRYVMRRITGITMLALIVMSIVGIAYTYIYGANIYKRLEGCTLTTLVAKDSGHLREIYDCNRREIGK